MGWEFPAVLGAALLLGMMLTVLQSRAYGIELQRAHRASTGAQDVLVSGRSRSITGGAIVVLVVDSSRREIVWGSALSGISVFSRFRRMPDLEGPVDTVGDRVRSTRITKAVDDAVLRLPRPRRQSAAEGEAKLNAVRSARAARPRAATA